MSTLKLFSISLSHTEKPLQTQGGAPGFAQAESADFALRVIDFPYAIALPHFSPYMGGFDVGFLFPSLSYSPLAHFTHT